MKKQLSIKFISSIAIIFSLMEFTGFSQNTQYGFEALISVTTGTFNSAFGYRALKYDTTGSYNTGIGAYSLFNNLNGNFNSANGSWALYRNISGNSNTANGVHAMYNNLTGNNNLAFGIQALFSNTIGSYNSAIGSSALRQNTTGTHNTAAGANSLYRNTSGKINAALGSLALYFNTTGNNNTACGGYALYSNTSGINNSAHGTQALRGNTTGSNNTANGFNALYNNTTGSYNTASGFQTLYNNSTGVYNTAKGGMTLYNNTTGYHNSSFGFYSLRSNTTGYSNVAFGNYSLFNNITGSCNTAVGYFARTSGNNFTNSIAIGCQAIVTGSNKARIGNTNITEIGGQVGWSILSDARFKKNIEQNVPGMEFIKHLKPVTYTYDLDALDKHIGVMDALEGEKRDGGNKMWTSQRKRAQSIVYTGFVAQEVEKAAKKINYNFSGVVAPQSEKDHYSLRYSEFVIPLVKAAQEQQEVLDAKTIEIENLKKELTVLKQMVKNLAKSSSSSLYNDTFNNSPIKYYPNPSSGIIELKIDNNGGELVQTIVYDLNGKVLYQSTGKEINFWRKIDLSNEVNGSYIVKTIIGEKTFQNKVLLQK